MVYVIKQKLIELGPKLIAYNLLYCRICSIKVFNHASLSDYVERISKSSKANLGSGKATNKGLFWHLKGALKQEHAYWRIIFLSLKRY